MKQQKIVYSLSWAKKSTNDISKRFYDNVAQSSCSNSVHTCTRARPKTVNMVELEIAMFTNKNAKKNQFFGGQTPCFFPAINVFFPPRIPVTQNYWLSPSRFVYF